MTAPQIGHDAGCSDCERDLILFGSRGVFGFFGFGGEFSISFVAFDPPVFGAMCFVNKHYYSMRF